METEAYTHTGRELNLKTTKGGKTKMENVEPDSPYKLGFQMVEVVKNINRFESSIKHKPNVFSVVVENSNLEPDGNSQDSEIEDYKQ